MKKMTLILFCLTWFSQASFAYTNDLTVVTSRTCVKAKGASKPFMLVLYRGENLVSAVIKCANAANLSGASFTGLGAVMNPTINYFNFATKKYQDKTLAGDYELISLNGDIAQSNKKLIAHMHATLGDEEYKVFGGHLSDAVVSATAEITIIPFQGKVIRKLDDKLGVALITA